MWKPTKHWIYHCNQFKACGSDTLSISVLYRGHNFLSTCLLFDFLSLPWWRGSKYRKSTMRLLKAQKTSSVPCRRRSSSRRRQRGCGAFKRRWRKKGRDAKKMRSVGGRRRRRGGCKALCCSDQKPPGWWVWLFWNCFHSCQMTFIDSYSLWQGFRV